MFQTVSSENRSKIYWLASYPRSGNTFTRILLSNYLQLADRPFPLNEIANFIPSDTSTALWQKLAPSLWRGEAAQEQKWQWRKSVIEAYREQGEKRPFPALKSHTANLPVFDQPAFQFQPGDKTIYIVRHPLDLVVSYADYNGRDLDKSIEIMCTSGICLDGQEVGSFEIRGSWAEHVASWLACKDCPILLVRYEDLCAHTEATFRDILMFLDIPVDSGKLGRAVEFSGFRSLQQQETAEGFRERPPETLSGRFFREGRARQWLKALSPEQAYRLADSCGEVMTRLGYTHPREVYFDGRNAYGPVRL